jgi:hypothetical protein
MNSQIESIIEPELLEAITEIAKTDLIIQGALAKSNSEKECINSLISAIICVLDREMGNLEKINGILKANPKVQEMLKGLVDDKVGLPEENKS